MALDTARQVELIEQDAKKLASLLRPLFHWVDNFSIDKGQMTGANLSYALVSYMGVKLAQKATSDDALLQVKAAKKSHRTLMGVVRPGADADTLARFPLLLHKTALLLGAPDGELIETRNNLWEGAPLDTKGWRTSKPRIVTVMWSAVGERTD